MTDLDLPQINAQLEGSPAEQVIRWAHEAFGQGLVMSSSFGAQAAVMLHLATRVVPDIPVIFIDTGYLFPETYRFAEALRERLGLNLKVFQGEESPARMEALRGKLWEKGVEGLTAYNHLRKVLPMQRALRELGAKAWLAGLRGDQTDHRSALPYVVKQNGLYKVHPILRWSRADVGRYLVEHDLPWHPLVEQGYASIGDTHTTRPVGAGEDERAGRFAGLKQECGLHLPTSPEEDASRESSGL